MKLTGGVKVVRSKIRPSALHLAARQDASQIASHRTVGAGVIQAQNREGEIGELRLIVPTDPKKIDGSPCRA